jgi:hypothetical protein
VVGEGAFMNSEVLAYAVAIAAITISAITVYIMRSRDKKAIGEPRQLAETPELLPLKGDRTVTNFDAQKSKKELRMLDVEQEILSYGIRRLYEAQAEGKLTDKEREQLAEGYKQRMREIKDSITENESVVALHDLVCIQENLIKLFNDRFDEINQKIGGLRVNLGVTPEPVVPKPPPELPSSEPEQVKRTKRKQSKPKRTEAEERIDQIRSEVEKVLERLGQMETEA